MNILEFCKMHKGIIMKVSIGLIIMLACCGGCSYINSRLGLPDDNPIEEAFEATVENYTGVNFDATPESKE